MYWSFQNTPVFFGWQRSPDSWSFKTKTTPVFFGSERSPNLIIRRAGPAPPPMRPFLAQRWESFYGWILTWIYLVLMGSQLISMVSHHGLYIYIHKCPGVVGPLPNGPNGLMGVTKYLLSEVTLQVGIDTTSERCVHVFYFWVCVANRCSSSKSTTNRYMPGSKLPLVPCVRGYAHQPNNNRHRGLHTHHKDFCSGGMTLHAMIGFPFQQSEPKT